MSPQTDLLRTTLTRMITIYRIMTKSIAPHAFGDHSKCERRCCSFKSNPTTYRHKDLPYGKYLHGEKLQSALANIFNDYCTDAVGEKLAPMTNSQRSKALNSVIGSKNVKIRFYGGSESNDFRVACGVAKTNLRYSTATQAEPLKHLT